jgi:hypothetical protein
MLPHTPAAQQEGKMHWLSLLTGLVLGGFITLCVVGAWVVFKCDGGLTFPDYDELSS